MRFVISARGEAREQYIVEATDEHEASLLFKMGNLPEPKVSEVYDLELVSIDAINDAE